MHEVGRGMVCKNAHGLHSLPVTKPLSTWLQGRYDYNTSVVRMSYECRLLRLNSLSSARKVVAETRTRSYLIRVVAGIAASGTRSLAFWFNDWHQRRRAATSNPSWASSRHTDRRTADLQHCSPTIQLLHTEARTVSIRPEHWTDHGAIPSSGERQRRADVEWNAYKKISCCRDSWRYDKINDSDWPANSNHYTTYIN